MRKRVAVFGIGRQFLEYVQEIGNVYDIVCLADNDKTKQGNMWKKFKILSIEEMMTIPYDYVLVIPNYNKMDIINSLRVKGIPDEKIIPWVPQGSSRWGHVFVELREKDCLVHFDDVRFSCSTTSDFICLEDVFVHNAYDFGINSSGKSAVMVDIGMNIGLTALFFANMPFIDKVYAYEPVTSTYECAVRNIAMNERLVSKIFLCNIGIGDQEKEAALLFDADRSDCTSIFSTAENEAPNVARVKLSRASDVLTAVMERHPNSDIYVKINAEGAEYPILSDLHKSGLIRTVKIFIMDVHFGREREIKVPLSEAGFVYFDRYGKNGHSMFYAVNSRF